MGLEIVELIMAWEEAFGIEFSDAEVERITTPRKVIDLIDAKLGPDHPWSREEVADLVRKIITEQLGVKEFSDDADFVKDLGVG